MFVGLGMALVATLDSGLADKVRAVRRDASIFAQRSSP